MNTVAQGAFADRIERYAERNPDASAPEVLGRFLVEPTDEHIESAEAMLSGESGARPPQADGETDGPGGLA